MLSRLFQQFFASIGVVLRMIRAIFTRSLSGVMARVRSTFSLTRQAAKLAPAMVKTASAAGKKPTKREDYIETRRMFISKSFLIMAVIAMIGLAALFYLIGWPWLMSHFYTAKMWCEDSRVTDYNGKVILYHEKEKKTPCFEGKLEDGIIQGEGKAFDENGRVTFSGSYVDNIYNGKGTLYTDGMLTYEGDFSDGLYEGKGRLYGESETLVYEGYFAAGLYEGKGKLYDGAQLLYEGDFAAGERSGEGVAYENEIKRYKGFFEKNLYHGEGILYDAEGNVLYAGSFSEGMYDGAGVLSVAEGRTIEAVFQAGEVLGNARCLANGTLYYEGGIAELLPDGSGTVYGSDGSVLFVGPMKNGAIDGGALVGLAADEIREMLGGNGQETVCDRGFTITSRALGLTVFCSFAQGDTEALAYHVYLYESADRNLPSMLWGSAADFEAVALTDDIVPESEGAYTSYTDFPAPLPVDLGTEGYCYVYRYENCGFFLWSQRVASAPILVQWQLSQEMPEPSEESSDSQGSESRLDALLGQLGLSEGGETDQAEGNPYYGSEDVAKLLEGVSGEDLTKMLMAALSYFEVAERRVVAEENLAICQKILAEEKALKDLGKGDDLRLAQLEDMAARLEVEIMKHVVQMRKDARTVKDTVALEIAEFDLQKLALLFDVSTLDIEALGEEAVGLAMEKALEQLPIENGESVEASGEEVPETEEEPTENGEETTENTEESSDDMPETEKTPSEEQEPIIESVDTDALRQLVEDSVLELELAYQDVSLALREYETALEALAQMEQKFTLGLATNVDRLSEQMVANNYRAALYTATVNFAKKAAHLNELTGGMLASQVGWMPEVLGN